MISFEKRTYIAVSAKQVIPSDFERLAPCEFAFLRDADDPGREPNMVAQHFVEILRRTPE